MFKYLTLLFFIAISPFRSLAANADYSASLIDKGLLKNADAVIREYSTEVNIESPTKVYITEHTVITVLNEKGNHFVNNCIEYSDMSDIEKIEGHIYDKDGSIVKKIRSSDFSRRSANANAYAFAEYSDDMQRYYYVDYRQYPYTVEYTVVTKQKHTFYLPKWKPQLSANCAIENASLHVTAPEDFKLRFKKNMVQDVTPSTTNSITTWQWNVKNVNAYIPEPLTYPVQLVGPNIILAPDKFECEGYAGNMATWKDHGQFIYEINKGRDVLPNETIDKVNVLIRGLDDDKKKINVLYNYLQRTTRYVYVGYGIGGWQTQDAAFVDKNKYGDCKALSNYMKALLKSAGIESYVVEIHAQQDLHYSLQKDFPHVESNHIILCIPSAKDTMWLECTSSNLTMNYLGDFTDDRTALMITPDGGVLVHTPVYDANVSWECRNAKIVCGDEGVLKVEMNNHYSGLLADELNNEIKLSQPKELQDYENTKFGMPSYSVDKFSLKPVENDAYMAVDEHVLITANSMYNKRGARYFVNMNVAPVKKSYTTMTTERKTSFFINHSCAIRDTFMLSIPANTTVEYIPEPVNAAYTFGRYHCNVTNVNGQLLLTREYIQHSGVYDKTLYHDYEKFAALVNSGNPLNIVLTHN